MSDERPNPFPGLRPFLADEDYLFFGREAQTDDLLRTLRTNRFMAVIGTSGSGKSSLVRAGLIPQLHGGFMAAAGSSWRIAVMRPGESPIGNLAAALGEALGQGGDSSTLYRGLLEATLRSSSRGLVDSVVQARIPADHNVLVLVDQLEELFRFRENEGVEGARGEAAAFIKLLLAAARTNEAPIYVVLTMRSDFIGNCMEFAGLPDAINSGLYLVPRMSRRDLRSAITGPVAVGGARLTPRLVTRLLNDAGDSPDQLPVLQHALMRVWNLWLENGGDGTIDQPLYEQIGTLTSALSQHAEEAWAELDQQGQSVARKLFKALTERSTTGQARRRPVTLEELVELSGDDEKRVEAVIDCFRKPGRSFLMPPAGTTLHSESVVDISHESLMRVWDRLTRWVDEEARSATAYRRLAEAASLHAASEGALWRDPQLQRALAWREDAQPDAAWARRYGSEINQTLAFLDASAHQRDRDKAEKKSHRRRVWLTWMLLAATLAVASAGAYVWTLKGQAEEAAVRAEEQRIFAQESRDSAVRERQAAEEHRRLAAMAKAEAEVEKERAVEQEKIALTERGRAQREEATAREQTVVAEAARREAEKAKIAAETERTAAELQRLLADESRRTAEMAEAEARRLRRLTEARTLAIQSMRLLHREQSELAALLARQAFLINAANGGSEREPTIFKALWSAVRRLAPDEYPVHRWHDGAVRAVVTSPDGRQAASAGDDGRVMLFALAGAVPPQELQVTGPGVRALAFSPDGSMLAAGGDSNEVTVFRGDLEPVVLAGGGGPISDLVFLSATEIAATTVAGRLISWNLADSGAITVHIDAHPHRLLALASAAGQELLAAASDGDGVLLKTPGEVQRMSGQAAGTQATAVAFLASGALAVGTEDGRIQIWLDPTATSHSSLVGHLSAVEELVFTDGETLVSASRDGSVRLWSWQSPELEPLLLDDNEGWVLSADVTVDGRLVVGGADRAVRLLPTRVGSLSEQVCAKVSRDLTGREWLQYLPGDLRHVATCPATDTVSSSVEDLE